MIEAIQNALIYVGMVLGVLAFLACLISARDLLVGNTSPGLVPMPPTKRRIKIILYLFGALICLLSTVFYVLVGVGVIPGDATGPYFRPIHLMALGAIGGFAIINSS